MNEDQLKGKKLKIIEHFISKLFLKKNENLRDALKKWQKNCQILKIQENLDNNR